VLQACERGRSGSTRGGVKALSICRGAGRGGRKVCRRAMRELRALKPRAHVVVVEGRLRRWRLGRQLVVLVVLVVVQAEIVQ